IYHRILAIRWNLRAIKIVFGLYVFEAFITIIGGLVAFGTYRIIGFPGYILFLTFRGQGYNHGGLTFDILVIDPNHIFLRYVAIAFQILWQIIGVSGKRIIGGQLRHFSGYGFQSINHIRLHGIAELFDILVANALRFKLREGFAELRLN